MILPVAKRFGIQPAEFCNYLSRQKYGFRRVIGVAHAICSTASRLGGAFLEGVSAANRLFPPRWA